MPKSTDLLCCLLLGNLFFALPCRAQAQSVADEALSKARSGQLEQALRLYEQALAQEPNNIAILRDYAAVLGSAGKYSEALPLVRKAVSLDARQPEWALREFAGIYLFGDALPEALETLDTLIRGGDSSEQTLNRRGLALRWLARSAEAAEAYRSMLKAYPDSEEGTIGLAYALADQGKFADGLALLKSQSPQTLKARIRILNWAGRHYEAQRLLDALSPGMSEDREILEDRVAASRWGGDPAGAVRYMNRLSILHPGPDADQLSRDLGIEYGHSIASAYRFSRDSFGLTERSASSDFTIHATPAHSIRLGYQYRWFDQDGDVSRALVRYELGWSGNLSRRISAYASAATVDYREPGLPRKAVGDASLSFALNDNVRLGGGGGRIVMDAFPALHAQVTAPFAFGEVSTRFYGRTELQGRYSRYMFSNQVNRDRADLQFSTRILSQTLVKLHAGWRFSGLWHDRPTPHFWSPSRFHSNLALVRAEVRITSWLDYTGEAAAGFQSEQGSKQQHPLQLNGRLMVHPGDNWRGFIEIGKSTSSVDRSLPGQRTYSRWFAGTGMEFRFR
jgi:tetratricopeptide (TPR) repeat protein